MTKETFILVGIITLASIVFAVICNIIYHFQFKHKVDKGHKNYERELAIQKQKMLDKTEEELEDDDDPFKNFNK